MSDYFYALRSKEGTAIINTDDGSVQVFEKWEQAVSAPKRNTDEVVAVSIKRIGGEQEASEIDSLRKQLAKANERVKELDEIADTAFKYNHSSAQCLRAWNKLQQLRKGQSDD